jgi:hypothetical protein
LVFEKRWGVAIQLARALTREPHAQRAFHDWSFWNTLWAVSE